MRSSLIATGGALLAAAVLFGGAAPATAGDDSGTRDRWNDSWGDWSQHYPQHCDVGVNDDQTYHHVTKQGVFAGTRDTDGCQNTDFFDDLPGDDMRDRDRLNRTSSFAESSPGTANGLTSRISE
ncbi:hypothetical protein [Nonomuraea sp. SYSU D8015]|uniref:hypothetical protein n=1 Tax=Nonomuraea sp. SYSU D8015 TaxID=2593644 RepID=UPI00166097F6|nr:hypothetical protein [Nonomuraea sp. SYSU D8015]